MKHQTVTGITIIVLLLAACAPPITTAPTITITPAITIVTPTLIPSDTTGVVKLLFVYSPGSPQFDNQRSIIVKFSEKNPDVEVTMVRISELDPEQEILITGISGHPIIVLYHAYHVKRIVGETSLTTLEEEYEAFKDKISGPISPTITSDSCT